MKRKRVISSSRCSISTCKGRRRTSVTKCTLTRKGASIYQELGLKLISWWGSAIWSASVTRMTRFMWLKSKVKRRMRSCTSRFTRTWSRWGMCALSMLECYLRSGEYWLTIRIGSLPVMISEWSWRMLDRELIFLILMEQLPLKYLSRSKSWTRKTISTRKVSQGWSKFLIGLRSLDD